MTDLKFKKMHGLGNCFIMMDDRAGEVSEKVNISELAIAVCNRNTGIGADGLILVRNSLVDNLDLRMTIINEDGSEPEMCGNGVRCFAKFVIDEEITTKKSLGIETLAGPILTTVTDDGMVEVDMGPPIFNNDDVCGDEKDGVVNVQDSGHDFTFVSMGNPHAITFVDNYDFDWMADGAKVEGADSFPNNTNVEFIKVIDKKEVVMKVWERGCGVTMACGTGACASVVAGVKTGKLSTEEVTVHLPGGDLLITWSGDGSVMMTGPAVATAAGTYFY